MVIRDWWHRSSEDRDWRKREGRFRDIDRDTADRHQIRPGPPPEVRLQTHREGGYHDGSAADVDS